VDSDADPSTGQIQDINLTADDLDEDMGLWFGPDVRYRLGDYVWHDENQDGIQDPAEVGVASIGVELYASDDCSGVPMASTTTDAAGKYEFSDLAAGTYCLQFTDILEGWRISPPNQGTDDTVDSDADPSTGQIQDINLTADDLDEDMGLWYEERLASLGDYVWLDVNRNGLQDDDEPAVAGVRVELYRCDGDLVNSQGTDGNGLYRFDDLEPGCYYVHFSAPGADFTRRNAGTNPAVDSDADAAGRTAQIDLDAGEQDMTWDAGLVGTPVVPEASTLVLLGSAAAGLVGYASLQIRARRRRS
jgi:hypothetical protein